MEHRRIVSSAKNEQPLAILFVIIVAQNTTLLMLAYNTRIENYPQKAYTAVVNRGAEQARRWDFYKLCAQVGGKR